MKKKNDIPPKVAERILSWFVRDDLTEEVLGDLEEKFYQTTKDRSSFLAKLNYWYQMVNYLRPFAIRKSRNLNHFGMFKSYFKIARRNLLKQKTFSLINISGLSIGLACCILIGIYIKDEVSYDEFHEKADKIYRLTREFKSPDGSTTLHLERLAPSFLPYLKEDFPEMEVMTRFGTDGGSFKYEDKLFIEDNIGWVDKEFFKIFSFDFVKGEAEKVLSLPGSMVITEEIALKYFGTTDALGKTIKFANSDNLKITGIIKEMPENAHFQVDMIGDFSIIEKRFGGHDQMMKAWGENSYATYFQLKEGREITEIERRFPEFLPKHLGEKANDWTALHVQKMTDIHLYSHLDFELNANSDIKYVYTFSAIALLILFIAIINYVNLATAKSAHRAKEVGMRKVMGAGKTSLVGQFITESVILVFIAILVSLLIVSFSLPYLREFTERTLNYTLQDAVISTSLVLILGLVIGILAGSYPAFYLSSFQPLKVLKGRLSAGSKNAVLRRSLVVVQFTISATLIASTGIVFQQLQYIQNKNLGFSKDHVITIGKNDEIRKNFEVFKSVLLSNASIHKVAVSHSVPTDQLLSYSDAEAEINGKMITPEVVIKNLRVGHDFIDTYQIELKAGRKFDKTIASDDTEAFILNEAAVKMIGWASSEDAIGRKMRYGDKIGRIIGVTEDVHLETLQNHITPLIMHPDGGMNVMSIKISGHDISETIGFIESTWSQFSPNTSIEYSFVDERFDRLYTSENQRAQLFTGFSLLAIFLACLGLFGLASFTVAQRSKEISIRKVLGATLVQITTILSKEFIILVGVSVIIGFPLTYKFMSDWLHNYAYRIDLNYVPFLVAGVLSVVIAFITISMQTLKAANSNPADMLRDE